MAREERLGDVRLYRAPIEVTVAAKSQKQIALLRQPSVKVSSYLRLRPGLGQYDPAVERVLVTRNRAAEGLGLALPAGKMVLFGQLAGRRILLGEVQVGDFAVGEKVEIPVAISTGVRAHQVTERVDSSAGPYRLTLTNDLPSAQVVEVQLQPSATALLGGPLVKREGWMIWRVTVPASTVMPRPASGAGSDA